MKTTDVARKDGSIINYCLMNDLPALVWAVNIADLELHTFLHRAPQIETPTALAFDLDPGLPADIVQCCKVGLWLKDLFAKLKLESFPKTSGSKGLQVFVPLNTRVTYEKTKAFAHNVAETLEREFPETVISKMQKNSAEEKFLWTGARTTNTKRRFALIRCAQKSIRRFQRR
jgi:bifunctional non-homologous end joining protein LigD